jgi:hypothetical protein
MASNAVDVSGSVLHGSGPRWLSPISQLESALLRNDLQQWGLLRQGATFWDDLRRVFLPTANCRQLASLDWLACASIFCTDPLRTPLPTIPLLIHDVAIRANRTENTVPSGTSIGYVAWRVPLLRHCLLCHYLSKYLGFQRICHNIKYIPLGEISPGNVWSFLFQKLGRGVPPQRKHVSSKWCLAEKKW